MLRRLFFFGGLLASCSAIAQVGAAPAAQETDYKLMGADMPVLRYILYQQPPVKNDTNIIKTQSSDYITSKTVVTSDTVVTQRGRRKRKSEQEETQTSVVRNTTPAKPVLTNKDLDNGANLIVMMFNPTCSHCQDETVMLEKNSALFKQSKVALVASPNMQPYLGDFIKYTNADQYPSFMYLGIDSSDFIKKLFLYQSLPQINIYDKHQKLIKTYAGEVPIDSLSKYIQ